MSAFFPALRDDHIAMIGGQSIFFVGTAPLAADGRVNVSPKGYDTFRVIDASTVAYLDLTGSGAETAAHLAENGRITVEAAHDKQLSFCLQDCGAAIENLLLAAPALGLGACWLGVHPREERMRHVREALRIPEQILPIAVVAVGVSALKWIWK